MGSTLGSERTKGWTCGVAKKGSDWLGSSTGPHTKESMDGKVCSVVQQGFDLLWVKQHTSVECMNCDMLLPVLERSYERSRKGTPWSSSQHVKAVGHSFGKKEIFWRKVYKILHSWRSFDRQSSDSAWKPSTLLPNRTCWVMLILTVSFEPLLRLWTTEWRGR
jgi:hypothetical protein